MKTDNLQLETNQTDTLMKILKVVATGNVAALQDDQDLRNKAYELSHGLSFSVENQKPDNDTILATMLQTLSEFPSFQERKVAFIKVIREVTGRSLMDSKSFVEANGFPSSTAAALAEPNPNFS